MLVELNALKLKSSIEAHISYLYSLRQDKRDRLVDAYLFKRRNSWVWKLIGKSEISREDAVNIVSKGDAFTDYNLTHILYGAQIERLKMMSRACDAAIADERNSVLVTKEELSNLPVLEE